MTSQYHKTNLSTLYPIPSANELLFWDPLWDPPWKRWLIQSKQRHSDRLTAIVARYTPSFIQLSVARTSIQVSAKHQNTGYRSGSQCCIFDQCKINSLRDPVPRSFVSEALLCEKKRQKASSIVQCETLSSLYFYRYQVTLHTSHKQQKSTPRTSRDHLGTQSSILLAT